LSISPTHELVVSDCEPKMISLIKTAILNNQLGYEFELVKKPVEKNRSNQIYFALTLITKEKRDRFIQRAKKIAEEGRVALNQIREKFRNLVKKEKSFSQDQKRNYEKQVDNLTKDYENKLMEAKEKKKLEN